MTAELVALKVDVIVAAGGSLGALAAKRATTTIPIVFPAVGNPVDDGLVASLARPGGNATGLAVLNQELIGKRLELIRQLVPHMSRAAFLLKPDSAPDRTMKDVLKSAEVAARALGVRLQVVEARGPEDFVRAFADMTREGANVLSVHSTPAFDRERDRLVALALKHRLPTVYSFRTYVDAGGLMSYGPDLPDLFRRAASYVDKILKGASPADLPVEQPTKFELVINLTTAKALGLKVPPATLAQADEVIER
jgi:putative ABC transport system substrate-binding protein